MPSTTTLTPPAEASLSFDCFGGHAGVLVMGDGGDRAGPATRRRLEDWHERLSRFEPGSELSQLNASARTRVHVSEILCRFVSVAVDAARRTGGLVDPTLVEEIETAGYLSDLGEPVPLEESLRLAPARRPARGNANARWRRVHADRRTRTVTRPRGIRLDSGGIAKGLFADLAGAPLERFSSYALDCSGDLRLGGRDGLERAVRVDDPFGRGVLHEFQMRSGGVATSGIGRRSWIGADGLPAHHLLDPSTGRPAFTGVVQATALAHTALDAEVRAKAALLSGPVDGPRWLAHGGVLVLDDGSHRVIEPREVDAR
jgi:thiamine biosynthesis lipoprotein